MPRAGSFLLLVTLVLLSASLQAQRGSAATGGNAARMAGGGRGVAAHRAAPNGFFSERPRFHHNRNAGLSYAPLWYGGPFAYEEAGSEPAMAGPVPPIIISIRPEEPPSRAAEIPAAKPLLIDIPSAANSATTKPLPPAIFVLANGQRLEARRYMLTAENLHITIDRRQLTFPLATLDLDRTVAANRDRGINLRIPADRNEISLGF